MSAAAGVDVPREPSAYRATTHFLERLHDRYGDYNRHADGDVVETCIREGDLTIRDAHTAHFRATLDGVTYRVVVNPTNGTAVSVYPVAIDVEAAQASDRWSDVQVADVTAHLAAEGWR